jgi:predicted nucleic acid-binding protein
VILRFILGDPPELFNKAQAIFRAVETGEVTLQCDPVNLAEVVWVLSSHYKVPCEEIARALTPLVSAPGILVPDKERYLRALALYGEGRLRFGDACACAAAELGCQGRLVSFDRALSRVTGIERVEAVVGGAS